MTTKTYKIIFDDNRGSMAIDAIAKTVNGDWRNTVNNYDGEGHDIGFVDFPEENEFYLKEILSQDDNVIEYKEQ